MLVSFPRGWYTRILRTWGQLMRWIWGEIVEAVPVTCTVCGRSLDAPDYDDDMCYIPDPDELTDEQWDQISEIWQVHPFELTVCEDCMAGHCGAVPSLTPDDWLAKHWEAYLNRQS